MLVVMTKVVLAEYDAAQNALKLEEPLEGVRDREKVTVTVEKPVVDPSRPWLGLSGSLSKEAGEDLARAIEELFPPWEK